MGVKICVRVFDQHFVVEKWIYFMSDTCLLKKQFSWVQSTSERMLKPL